MIRGKACCSQPKLDLVTAVVGRVIQFFHLFIPLFPLSGSLNLGLVVAGSPGESSAADEWSVLGQSKQPTFIPKKYVDGFDSAIESAAKPKPTQSSETNLPSGILSVLPGAGRGKPLKQPDPAAQVKEENRHLGVRQQPSRSAPAADPSPSPAQPKLSQEEAVKKAMGILSRGGDGEDAGGMVKARAEGGGGRGMGRGRGRRRGRRRGERRMVVDRSNVKYSEEADNPYAGEEADEEKLIQEIGRVTSIVDGFLDARSRVVHSPLDDAYLDAFHTNCLLMKLME
ncbi:hypothetical protein SLE2022_221860 [Rubroshorea leprosula]